MATENGAVELGIQSLSAGAKLGQEMGGRSFRKDVFEARVGQIPHREVCAQGCFAWEWGIICGWSWLGPGTPCWRDQGDGGPPSVAVGGSFQR